MHGLNTMRALQEAAIRRAEEARARAQAQTEEQTMRAAVNAVLKK